MEILILNDIIGGIAAPEEGATRAGDAAASISTLTVTPTTYITVSMTSVGAKLVYTGKELLTDAVVTFDDGRITSVTPSTSGSSTAKRTPDAQYEVITPAFIDPHAHIGMMRSGEPGDEAEANDQMDPIIAHADALDSVQMDDTSFRDSVEAGVLYSCVVPGSGNIVGGRSAVIRNYGAETNSALIRRAGIKAAIGYNPMSTRTWKGTRPYTRMGSFALLRGKLHDAKEKMKKTGETDVVVGADEQVFRSLVKGREILRVHVHKSDDIAALLRLVDEFRLKITVEHSCDVHNADVYRNLKKRGISVVYGPIDAFSYKVELKHATWRNLAYLLESGVSFGLMTDHPVVLQEMLLYQLRWFLRLGVSKQEAIEIITRKNARIIGIEDIAGTLEPKKWASFICWNGDPFALTSYPVEVYGEGRSLIETNARA